VDIDYDVIVAGGGLTGTVAAQSISHYSNQNLSILSIDRNPEMFPGRKSNPGWTCGDACSKEAVDFMTERIKIPWTSPEIEHDVKGVMAFSPDKETAIPFDGDGYMLNRQKLPEIQNARTKKMGVNFDFEINLTGLIYDGSQVVGVQGINNKTKQPYKKTAKVVVDATGVTSMLRNQIQNSTKIERKIDRRDLESTGRHIMYFDKGEEDLTEFDPDYCIIHLDQDIAPGGYGWVFPKADNKVNIGLGVEKSILKDTSKSLFKGMIRINEQAAHSNSFLSGRSILLSKGAKSDSIPGLEILTNDVKATHSASVAQMDDEQIFYLGTRCLSYSEAERIIVEGFLEPLSRTMSHQVRAWISNIIESKWANKELTINMDEHLKAIVEVEETRYNENEEVEQHYKYR